MKEGAVVTATNEITLVTLQNCPSDIAYLSKIFEQIAKLGINIDMISLAPAHGALTALSFTISDNDLGAILEFTATLRESSNIRAIVSSGNSKIAVYDERMRNTPGIAAKVLLAASAVNTDLRLISTSDVEISILVTPADYPNTLASIESAMAE